MVEPLRSPTGQERLTLLEERARIQAFRVAFLKRLGQLNHDQHVRLLNRSNPKFVNELKIDELQAMLSLTDEQREIGQTFLDYGKRLDELDLLEKSYGKSFFTPVGEKETDLVTDARKAGQREAKRLFREHSWGEPQATVPARSHVPLPPPSGQQLSTATQSLPLRTAVGFSH